MEHDIQKLFKQAIYQPESRLSGDIWRAIEARNRKLVRIRFWVYSAISSLSFVSLFPAIKQLGSSFQQSGFYEYFSLIFSDGKVVILYWKEISLSLVESLPTLNIILLLSIVFVLIISLRFMARNIRGSLLLTN